MPNQVMLFGAGASKGSDDTGTPPLGEELLEELQEFNPDGWGAISNSLLEQFQDDFEQGMIQLADENPHFLPPLQRAMAAYFFRFIPLESNLYVQLAQRIRLNQWQGALVTMNYERFLELSLIQSGLRPIVSNKMENSNDVELCLPHGCCHIFCESVRGMSSAVSMNGNAVSTSGRVMVITDPAQFNDRIQNDAFPPVMSYFNPKKNTTSGVNFIMGQRDRWANLCDDASVIAIIGVRVRPHDEHIWGPLKDSNAKIIYCGGESAAGEFVEWQGEVQRNGDDVVLNEYFLQSFDRICDELDLDN